MNKMNKNQAKMLGRDMAKAYADICNEYLRIFCEKHELTFDPGDWVGGESGVGTVVNVADYFVSMEDIRFDIDNNVPAETFFEFQDYDAAVSDVELSYDVLYNPSRDEGRLVHINYPSFCKGAPRPYSDKALESMRTDMAYMAKRREEFLKTIEQRRMEGHD